MSLISLTGQKLRSLMPISKRETRSRFTEVTFLDLQESSPQSNTLTKAISFLRTLEEDGNARKALLSYKIPIMEKARRGEPFKELTLKLGGSGILINKSTIPLFPAVLELGARNTNIIRKLRKL